MSGGSYNYMYSAILHEYGGRVYDDEFDKLLHDLVKVLHDLEWWQSSDISESDYKKTLNKFKKKWLKDKK